MNKKAAIFDTVALSAGARNEHVFHPQRFSLGPFSAGETISFVRESNNSSSEFLHPRTWCHSKRSSPDGGAAIYISRVPASISKSRYNTNSNYPPRNCPCFVQGESEIRQSSRNAGSGIRDIDILSETLDARSRATFR